MFKKRVLSIAGAFLATIEYWQSMATGKHLRKDMNEDSNFESDVKLTLDTSHQITRIWARTRVLFSRILSPV